MENSSIMDLLLQKKIRRCWPEWREDHCAIKKYRQKVKGEFYKSVVRPEMVHGLENVG